MNSILTSNHHKRLYLCASPSANFGTDGQSLVVLCYESEGHLFSRIQMWRLCELVRTAALDYSNFVQQCLRAGYPGYRDSVASKYKRFSSSKRPAGSGTQPTSSSLGTGGRFRRKRPGREVCHSALFGAKVKNVWSYTSCPTIRLHGVNRDNSTTLIVVEVAGGKGGKGVLAMPPLYRELKYRAPKLLIAIYSLPSLFAGSYFVVSHNRHVTPTRKIHHSNPSVDSSVEIFRTRTSLRATPHDVQGADGAKRSCCNRNVFAKKRKIPKNTAVFFGGGGGSFFRGFSLSARVFGT